MYKNSALAATVAVLGCAVAHADVTVQEQTNVNVAIIKAHGSSTRAITDDKERSETDFRCDGFMSMFCGKNSSLEIIRLDRSLTMTADTKKKTYVEKPFPTPEQMKVVQEHINAVMEKMKSCPPPPAAANQPSVDTSKCTMSPPTSTVSTPNDTATFAGHAAHHTIMTMTQSCANPDTGDTCDMAYTFDVWSSNEELPEMAARQTFTRNYLHAMGLDEQGALGTPAAFSQFLAPYKDAMKKMAGDSASSLKGYPLKTIFRVAMGGPKCKSMAGKTGSAGGGSGGADGNVVTDAGSAAAGAAASTSEGVANAAASEAAGKAAGGGAGGAIANSAAGAFAGKLIGGLFSKKKAPDAPPPSGGSGSAGTASTASAPAGMFTLAEVSVETTSINTGAVTADQFEMPADYKKVAPPPEKAMEEPTCPKYGP